MPRLIAFLRAINVGGRNVTMKDLCGLFSGLGLREVESFIASGNLLFSSGSRDLRGLERRIEACLHSSLGYEVRTFVRTDAEVAAIAHYRPFSAARLRSAAAFNVGFLAEPLGPEGTRTLMGLKTSIDDFQVHGREVYWLCRGRQGESTFSNAVFERALKIAATFRGMNTISRLTAKYGFAPAAV